VTESLPDKLLAVHRALDAAGYRHAFGGAIALAYHVEQPRATADIDVNVQADPQDAEALFAALPEQFGHAAKDARALRRDGQCRLYWDRTPLDLFLPQHELHATVQSRAMTVDFAGAPIPILSATDLIVFKSLFDRTKDWADIEEMLRPGALGKPDLDEVRHWLEALIGADDPRLARLDQALRRAGSTREPRSFREALDPRPPASEP
jgi:hypothetical protein